MMLTLRQWLLLALVLVSMIGAWTFRDYWQVRKELKDERKTTDAVVERGERYDTLVTENINEGAAIDRGTQQVHDRRQEIERNEPAYREYLDRPLPEQSLRLYRDAAAAVAAARGEGADDSGRAAEQEDR